MPIVGHGIGGELAKAFGITHKLRWLEVRCAVDEVVTVRCEILPDNYDGENIKSILQEYTLEPRKDKDNADP